MIAKTLALTLRSIREDARLLRTHLFRLFLLLVIFWFLVLTQWDDIGVGAPGLGFFSAVTYLNFVFITMAGIGFFASAITEEKEEETLGLLRMAGIGPLALLLGKLMPRLLGAVLLLSAQFPFTLLAITLGGVTLEQVAAAYCTLLTYTLLLAGVALFCSVASRLTRTAAFTTTITVVLFLFVPWWFLHVMFWRPVGSSGTVAGQVLLALDVVSPLTRLNEVMASRFVGRPFGVQAVGSTVVALAFFLLSWLTFNWFNRDERSASPSRGMILRSSSRLRRLTGGRVWSNALFWKDMHFMGGGMLMILCKFGLFGLAAVALYVLLPALSWRGTFSWDDYGECTMSLAILVFIIESTLLASNVFRQEVKWNTLPSLIMLPYSLAGIAYSKIAGCMLGLIPVVTWFYAGMFCAPKSLGEFFEDALDEPVFWLMVTHYFLLLHVAAFLSLFVKWMAFPLAFGVVIMVNVCCIGTMDKLGARGDEGPAAVMIFLGGFAMIVLHLATGERLKSLARR